MSCPRGTVFVLPFLSLSVFEHHHHQRLLHFLLSNEEYEYAMLLLLLVGFALLGCASQTAALAVVGRQEPDQLVTRGVVDKRESGVFKIQVVTDTFSVIYSNGDPSKATTAAFGFNFRVDYQNSVWGLCTKAIGKGHVSNCGLAANCIDKFACSDGCGRTGSGLITISWYVSLVYLPLFQAWTNDRLPARWPARHSAREHILFRSPGWTRSRILLVGTRPADSSYTRLLRP